MSTRTFRFFVRLPEFLDMINELAKNLELYMILYRLMKLPQKLFIKQNDITLKDIQELCIDEIYLSKEKPDIDSVDPTEFAPGELGWIHIELPKENNNILYMSDIGVKTNWYDSVKKINFNNENLLPVYNKFTSKIKRNFKFPVRLYNIDNPQEIFVCRGIGFTEAVRNFEKEGGKLMQDGVDKQLFTTI